MAAQRCSDMIIGGTEHSAWAGSRQYPGHNGGERMVFLVPILSRSDLFLRLTTIQVCLVWPAHQKVMEVIEEWEQVGK